MKRLAIVILLITPCLFAQSAPSIAVAELTSGSSWTMQQLPFSQGSIDGITFINQNSGWAVGYNESTGKSVLLKTTNGGSNWSSTDLDFTASELSFINSNTGFIAGGYRTSFNINKTTNGGGVWTECNLPELEYARSNDIFSRSSTEGWAVGRHQDLNTDAALILKTNDGQNWELADFPHQQGTLKSIYFLDDNYGWAAGDKFSSNGPLIFYSSDGGDSWSEQSQPLTSGSISDIFFFDQNNGWACGGTGFGVDDNLILLKTSDGGNNWSEINTGLKTIGSNIIFTSATTGYMEVKVKDSDGTWSAQIYKTTDGGLTWYERLNNIPGFYSGDISFVEGSLWAWLAGSLSIPSCGVSTRVLPVDDAGTISPSYVSCECGSDQEITFTAEPNEGWLFLEFQPPPPVYCPQNGTSEVTAMFAPYLTFAGGTKTFLCAREDNTDKPIHSFSLTASQADDWQISSLTFSSSGAGDDREDITELRLFEGGQKIASGRFSGDNGELTFNFSQILIPASATKFFSIYADFVTLTDCPETCKDYNLAVSANNAIAKNYAPGVRTGSTICVVNVGCVWNADLEECYDNIQLAVDDASDNNLVQVCPGTYQENIDINKSLALESFGEATETFITAASSSDHVVEVSINNVSIEGFTIQNSTGGFGIKSDEAIELIDVQLINNGLGGIQVGENPFGSVNFKKSVEITETGTDSLYAENLVVKNNGGSGILVRDDVTLAGTTLEVKSNNGDGIVSYKGNITVKTPQIQISDNNGYGVAALDGDYKNGKGVVTFLYPTNICRNDSGGIVAITSVHIPPDFIVEDNGGVGIDGGEDFECENIKIRNNGDDGLWAHRHIKIKGSNNEIKNNNGDGIVSWRGNILIEATGIDISGNKGFGVSTVGDSYDEDFGTVTFLHPATIARNDSGGIISIRKLVLPPEFVVENNGGFGIDAGEDFEAENIKIRNNGGDGLWVGRHIVIKGSDNEIINNEGDGILSYGGNILIEATGIDISGNKGFGVTTVGDSYDGDFGTITFLHPATIANNDSAGILSVRTLTLPSDFVVENNGSTGIDAGADFECENVKIRNNGGDGLWVGNNIIIKGNDNEITNNERNGIFSYEGSILIQGSGGEISGNKGNGIYSQQGHITINSPGIKINGNNEFGALTGVGSTGFILFKSSVEVNDNDSGAVLAMGDLDLSDGFTALFNEQLGVLTYRNLYAHNVKIRGNSGDGIYCEGNAEITGNNTEILYNSGNGVYILGSGEINGGDISYNGGYGVVVNSDAPPNIKNTRIQGNALGGIHIRTGSNGVSRDSGKNESAQTSELALPAINQSMIINNNGDGILNEGDADIAVSQSNIYDNDGMGINNTSSAAVIYAEDNWWGDASGPGGIGGGTGDEVGGNVSISNWLTNPVALVVSPASDDMMSAVGQTDSVMCFFQNWQEFNDVIDVEINDTQGWLISQSNFSLEFADSLGANTIVIFEIPSDTESGTASVFTIRATSQTNNNWKDTASFIVRIYESTLAAIEINPETVNLEPEETQQFEAIAYDQHSFIMNIAFNWNATGGEINSSGLYTAAGDTGTFVVVVSDAATQTVTDTALVHISGITGIEDEHESLPEEFALNQNYPNPFNPSTVIEFALPEDCFVNLTIYNSLGEEVVVLEKGYLPAGNYKRIFNASGLPSGVYIYRLTAGSFVQSRKAIYMR